MIIGDKPLKETRHFRILPTLGISVSVLASAVLGLGIHQGTTTRTGGTLVLNGILGLALGFALLAPWIFSKVTFHRADPRAEWRKIRSKGLARFMLIRGVIPFGILIALAWDYLGISKSAGTSSSVVRSSAWIAALVYYLIATWLEWRRNERAYAD